MIPGERLAMALDSPPLEGLRASTRFEVPHQRETLDRLSHGERAALRTARSLRAISLDAAHIDADLRSILCDELRDLAEQIEGLPS